MKFDFIHILAKQLNWLGQQKKPRTKYYSDQATPFVVVC